MLLGYAEEQGKRDSASNICVPHPQGSEWELSKHATDKQPAGFHSCNGALGLIFFAGKLRNIEKVSIAMLPCSFRDV